MTTDRSNSKRIAKNTGYLFFRMLLVMVIGLYTSRLVLKYLGVDDYGIYNVVGSVVIFFSFLKNALTNATYRYIAFEIGSGNSNSISKMFSMAINCHFLLVIFFFCILELIGPWFLNNYLTIPPERIEAANWAFQFSIMTFCVSIIQNPFHSTIIAYEMMNFYALLSFLEVAMKLLIVFLLIVGGIDRLIMYTALLFAVSVIILSCYCLFVKVRFKDCRYIKYWDTKLIKEFSAYSGWSLIVNITDVCTTQSISIFFNMFIGLVANASLGICNQVTSQINMFLANFTQAFNPQIIKSYASGNIDYFMKLVVSSSKLSFYLLFVVSLPVLINTEFLLGAWLGQYPTYACDFIRISILYFLIDATQAPLWNAVHATGNIKWHQIIVSSIKILAIPLMFITLKLGYGANIALAEWVILNLITAFARTLYVDKHIGLSAIIFYRKVFLKILPLIIVVTPCTFYIHKSLEQGWESFLVSSFMSTCCSVIIILILGLDESEKRLLLSTKPVKKLYDCLPTKITKRLS